MCLEKKRVIEKERVKKEIGSNTGISNVLPFLPPWVMVEQDSAPSSIMPSHLQKLVKHGFTTTVELKACWVLEDPGFPTLAEGYMVFFMAFYEWGFSMPPHWFLRSLLW
jgi:hypothetical protein